MSSGTNTIHTSMAQATSTGTPVASQQSQQAQAQQGQQQIHLQQSTTTTAIHAGNQQVQAAAQQQHHHAATPTNPMQQLQVIQQPLQNQYLQQLYSTQQGQILMNGNLLHHPGINPQIQVIAANGKTFQTNQLGHPLLNTSYTIPTSSANTQPSYIIGQLSNGQVGLIQQTHQQPGKPGEMQKVLSPQIGTQLPQGLWTSPHTLFQSNPIFIRGTQPDQMFIQQQQPLHTNTSSHQHFSMQPITAQTGQIPSTSIATAAPASIQAQQQQQNVQQAGGQQQQQQGQQIAPQPIQPQPANVVSIKAPATLQPKPLQIQPQPNQAGQQQQQQSLQQQQQQTLQQQIQQVAMAHSQHQLQIIPQPPTSSQGVLSQQQITGLTPGTITMQTSAGPQQIQTQQTPRQLTILPQQHQAQAIQPQVSIVQQTQQQQQQQAGQQPIRPNFTIVTQNNTASVTMSQVAGPGGAAAGATPPGQQQQQRPKVKKVVSKGAPNATTPTNPQANKAVFPRPVQPATSVTPIASQQYLNNGTLTFMHPQAKQATLMSQNAGATLTKVQMSSGPQQQNQQMMQPLKTINISALHSNLPDATLTPLMPQQASVAASAANQVSQPIQVYSTTTTQLPSPVVSITPAPPPPHQQAPQPTTPSKKDDSNADSAATENKNDTEKENAKTNGEESEETSVKQNKPPKAMVKPQVLTHVIEGFVIQEASEPFPMPRNNGDMDEPPKKKAALSIGAEMGKCEMCGKVDLKAKFKKNKRFCSSTCAKSMKSANQQQQQSQQQQTHVNHLTNGATTNGDLKSKKNKKWADGDAELTDETCSSVGDASILSPNDDQQDEEPKVNPVKWSVSEVVEFVKSLPGCCEYAEDFAVQEIDGQALLLLKEDHLMSAIGMKLGPALKLCAKIEGIRSASSGGAASGDANANKA